MAGAWLCHPVLSAPMSLQMAFDEILFRRLRDKEIQQPVLRIYFSSEPWMTTGYSDSGPFPETMRVCKRITGGGRVYHGDDLVFSLCARKEDDESFTSVRISYWKIHEAVKKAFEKKGAKPEFYRCDEALPRGAECFVNPIATDLGIDRKKVAGGAQKRSLGTLLHQESLQLPSGWDALDFQDALKSAFADEFKISWQEMFFDPEIMEEAKVLAEEKYKNLNEKLVTV